MYGVTRTTATLIGAAVAGFLVWLATQFGDSTGGYWARYGVVAAAGLVVALSQLLGGWTKWGMPRLARSVFLFAFLPTLVVVGWILLFHQPGTNSFADHVTSWSGDLGIGGFVDDLGSMLPALAFGLGLVFGLSFDTAGPRRPEPVAAEEPVDTRAADEPLTAERSAEPEPVPVAVAEPDPEPAPRNEPPA
jgi:hypothetical protein